MSMTSKQRKYIRWMQGQLEKGAGVDDETRRDFMQSVAGVRTCTKLSHDKARRLIHALQKELAKIGIRGTSKGTRAEAEKAGLKQAARESASTRLVEGGSTVSQQRMLWSLGALLGMSDIVLYGFVKERITDGRTGDPARLTNAEVTHAKRALEARVARGDKISKPRTSVRGSVKNRKGNVLEVEFGG